MLSKINHQIYNRGLTLLGGANFSLKKALSTENKAVGINIVHCYCNN
jgi:hypothetical protein